MADPSSIDVLALAATVIEWTAWSDRHKNGLRLTYSRGVAADGTRIERRSIDGVPDLVGAVTPERVVWARL